ncbi:MAG: hypothetical protein JWO69_250 [Thermoleophilia bacterium]|jgi:outer membrane murein-binding lipoprotein Lpp|nr:hypothetical protein [Thermoleophilia bacterium]
MTRCATTLLVAALSTAALVLSGCTARQSRDQYETRLEQAVSVRTEVTGDLDERELGSMESFETATDEVSRALRELDADAPPRDVEDAHERMVRGLEGLVALLDRRGRCEALVQHSEQDARACRQSIGQDVYDQIRNDFGEADTIYRQEGFSLPGMGGGEGETDGGDDLDGGAAPDGGDEL